MNFLSFINRRLWLKLLIPVSFIVFLVIAASVLFNSRYQEKLSLEQMRHQNLSLSQVVESSMFDSLSTGDNDVVRRQFERIKATLPGIKIFVYDYNGQVAFSTQADDVGKPIRTFLPDAAKAELNHMLQTGKDFTGGNQTVLHGERFVFESHVIHNEAKCHHCHGESRKILGGITLFSPAGEILNRISKGKMVNWFAGAAGLVLIIAFVWLFFHFSVNLKVRMILNAMEQMQDGDFTMDIDVPKGDEMNHILSRISMVNKDLRQVLNQVKQGSEKMLSASKDLEHISGRLADASTATSARAKSVTAAAEEMNTTNRAIANAMEKSSGSVSNVALAVDEMSATITEIARNVNTSREFSLKLVNDFGRVEKVVDELKTRADEVDSVTDEIRAIAEQVSLLALNAKIEAARAGEAGKGFAVVAEEITTLALDTNHATVEADEKLLRMKEGTTETVSLIQTIAKLIQDTEESMKTISDAVEEQDETSRGIAESVASVSDDVMQVNGSIGQSVEGAGEIARNITIVGQDSQEVKINSDRLNENAKHLSGMAKDFEQLVSRFKV